jgi:hypothetical protein
MDGATCYATIKEGSECSLEMFMINGTSTYSYLDVAIWHDDCIASGNDCRRFPGYEESMDGNLTYNGRPLTMPSYSNLDGWMYRLTNRIINGKDTIEGNNKIIYYDCQDWNGAYSSRNVSSFCCSCVYCV